MFVFFHEVSKMHLGVKLYIIIFVYVWFLPWKFQKFLKMHLGVQVSKILGRLIVQTFTTDVSNHLINFPMCTECKKGLKPIKRPKTKD